MKEVTTEVRKHFLAMITPLEVNGQEVTVSNILSSSLNFPFVIVSTSATGDGTKCSRDWLVTTTIDIVVKTSGDWGGDKLTEDIANEIYEKIDSNRPSYGITDNFTITTQTVEAADPFLEQYNNGRVLRKTITIQNYVSILN
ncbi:MAG: hypothetical protein EA392_01520 [Cryomorphaceae bacterium]|nr:MAG: hypothetical protein EA392_01520 [Cryomorphaceae bacterium]